MILNTWPNADFIYQCIKDTDINGIVNGDVPFLAISFLNQCYIHVVQGKHMLICPSETRSSPLHSLLFLFNSPFSDAACLFIAPSGTVIGRASIRRLFLFLRFTKATSKNINTVTSTPPKKLPSATPTELIGLLEPSLRPGKLKKSFTHR